MSEMTAEGLELFGAIVSKNVSDLAYTTDLLLDGKDAQIKSLAQTVVAIDCVLDNATVIDRETERALMKLRGQIDAAYFALERLADS